MLYKAIDVWKRQGNEAFRYRCFQLIPSGRYCVQSMDCYRSSTSELQSKSLDKQLIELFLEQAPEERSGSFATLEEAIEAHDQEFAYYFENRSEDE